MSDRTFAGRTALVTGGTRGIGRAVCVLLASQGARVAVNYQGNEAAAQQTLELVRQAGCAGITVQGDVARPADVEHMVARTREHLGPIDFLVNNAAVSSHVPHEQLTFADWK